MKAKSTLSAEESRPTPATPAGDGRNPRLVAAVLGLGLLAIAGLIWLQREHRAHRNAPGRDQIVMENQAADKGRSKSKSAATPAYEPKLQDRAITGEQKARFVRTLHNAPHGTVTIAAFKGDRETYLYAAKIASILSDAGYASSDPPVSLLPATETPQNPPVLLFVSSQAPIPRHALAIKDALDLIGIRCEFSYRETPGHPGDLQIGVYPNP
ncbi:hypothetical protein CfE428DRAFT_5089 [Chthoniobacter flavus Ellin428]|uniref:Uncharacterized protein n=1 Tax=Chthoniobacter flavus Ellin428 TaxID=497964 RepID=B4D849_9BACT|nr:hypothetical protein [Chthoniobacter flavus]EDY17403.1 hypothetical protein CfE428DRAFT_5089 [Chthoniobacter flavus Ellin428]TCO87350.1 hypothetical protein EV701_12229 [Chthoniobacter flavus]